MASGHVNCHRDFACATGAFAGGVTLQDKSLRIAFDSESGTLIRLENKTTRWVTERLPELGVSFRLDALLPDRTDDMVLAKSRALPRSKNFRPRDPPPMEEVWVLVASGAAPLTTEKALNNICKETICGV